MGDVPLDRKLRIYGPIDRQDANSQTYWYALDKLIADATAWSASWPAGTTSLPMPSPGMVAMR